MKSLTEKILIILKILRWKSLIRRCMMYDVWGIPSNPNNPKRIIHTTINNPYKSLKSLTEKILIILKILRWKSLIRRCMM